MERRLLLIMSLWLAALNAAVAEDQRPLEFLINLISEEPKAQLGPSATYVVLEELAEHKRKHKVIDFVAGKKITLQNLVELNNDEYWIEHTEDIYESGYNERLIEWLPNPNVADYIFNGFAKHFHQFGGRTSDFVEAYKELLRSESQRKKFRSLPEDQSDSNLELAQLDTELNANPDMSLDDTYRLLVKYVDEGNMTYGRDKRILIELLNLSEWIDFDCDSYELPDSSFGSIQSVTFGAYVSYIKNMLEDDCKFKSMSPQERESLPMIDQVDCKRILKSNRVRLTYREVFDISKTLDETPTKCPRFADQEFFFEAIKDTATCSGAGCCEELQIDVEKNYTNVRLTHVELADFVEFYEYSQQEARKICAQWISQELENRELSLIGPKGQVMLPLDVIQGRSIEQVISLNIDPSSLTTESRQKRKNLDIIFRQPCRRLNYHLTLLLLPQMDTITKKEIDKHMSFRAQRLFNNWAYCQTEFRRLEEVDGALRYDEGLEWVSGFLRRRHFPTATQTPAPKLP